MGFLKWIVIILAIINFGFMAADGSRALIKGDYFRPAEGPYAGQLGPWATVVKHAGIDPETTTMKIIFLCWGICGIVVTTAYATGTSWGFLALLLFDIGTLWYLVAGTISSALQVVLLLLIKKYR